MKVSIAMATYNGAKYLQEQLDSLSVQALVPYELVVCDDGSSDDTLGIIQQFADTAPFPVRVYQNEKNLGYADNFLKAARLCEGDWVAFCDQDDVWLPHKLADCSAEIESHPDLLIVLQNAELCDEGLKSQRRVFPDKVKPGFYQACSQYGFWVWPGCLQTVSSRLFEEFNVEERLPNYFPGHLLQSHDKWTCMLANALGGILVVQRPAALYRRHEQALTGPYADKTVTERIRKARHVDASHYRFLAKVASSSADYLRRAEEHVARTDWKALLAENASWFRKLSDIQDRRAELYEQQYLMGRLRCYALIFLKGGYVGPRFTQMGVLSALKDASRVVGGRRAGSGSGL